METKTTNSTWIKDALIASIFPLLTIALFAIGEWQHISFSSLGIRPRKLDGVIGILTSPLVHGSWDHVLSNALPLWVLSFYILQNYRSVFLQVLFYGILMAGFWTWLSARDARHIGASGEVYVMFGFLFLSGFLNRSKRTMGTTLLVIFMYGGLIWGIFPEKQEISYEGHFWGLVGGLILAWFYRHRFEIKRHPLQEAYQNQAYINNAERRFGKFYWDKAKHEAWLKDEQERLRKEEEERSKRENAQHIPFYYTIKKGSDDSSKPS